MYKVVKIEVVRTDGGTWSSVENFDSDMSARTNEADRAAFLSACDLDRAGVHTDTVLKEGGAKAVNTLVMSEQCWNHYMSGYSNSDPYAVSEKAGVTQTIMSGPEDMAEADAYAAFPEMDPVWIEQNVDVPPPPAEVNDGVGEAPEPDPDPVPGEE